MGLPRLNSISTYLLSFDRIRKPLFKVVAEKKDHGLAMVVAATSMQSSREHVNKLF
jgi:hypothetical protein